MELTFRPARADEVDTVCGLYRAASKSPFSVWNEEYPTLQDARHDLETGNLFILTADDQVIGAISIVPECEMDDLDVWQFTDGTHREIARICISQDFQGKGLAAVMVTNIIHVLKERGCHSIRLSAAVCNLPACKTYGKLGFEIRGEADLFGSHYYLLEKAI